MDIQREAEDDYNVTFSIRSEDHTLANSLRFMLNKDPNVYCCGYSLPHPNDDIVQIRIQTTGEISAAEALGRAAINLKNATIHIRDTMKNEIQQAQQKFQAQN